jgi:hypothetical protein
MKFKSRLTGLDDLKTAVAGIANDAELRQQVRAAVDDVRQAAIESLSDGQPPDSRTGELAKSLIVEIAGDGKSASIGTPFDYGWHLEMGSLSRPATPWLEPAFNDSRSAIMSRIRLWLANSAKRARR